MHLHSGMEGWCSIQVFSRFHEKKLGINIALWKALNYEIKCTFLV
jgi:hypothetical protein